MAFMRPVAQYFTAEEAEEYTEGECAQAGWYSRLSAPGYLDCTDWVGPFETEDDALRDCMEAYDVDENGDDLPVEDEELYECVACHGEAYVLGILGHRAHYRCRDCGWSFNAPYTRTE